MQIFLRTLLAVYLAHLAADFVFQTQRLVDRKKRGQSSAYLVHGLIHYLSAILIVGFFIPGSIAAQRTHLVIAGLALVHLLIDFAKVRLAPKGLGGNGAASYIADQLVHLLTVVLRPGCFSPACPLLRSAPCCKLPEAWELNFSPCRSSTSPSSSAAAI